MKPPLINEDVKEVLGIDPYAYCISDKDGFFITSDRKHFHGQGKSPTKAWRNAAEAIKALRKKSRKKKRGAQTPV